MLNSTQFFIATAVGSELCTWAGFTELEDEDRVALFKQGSFEVIVTRYTPLLTSEGMFTPDMTVLIPRSATLRVIIRRNPNSLTSQPVKKL